MKHLFEALWLIVAFVSISVIYYLIKSWLRRYRQKKELEYLRFRQKQDEIEYRRRQLLTSFNRLCDEELPWFEVCLGKQPQVRLQISKGPDKQTVIIETALFTMSEQEYKKLLEMGALSIRVLSDACQIEFKAKSFGFPQFIEQLLEFISGKKDLNSLEIKA